MCALIFRAGLTLAHLEGETGGIRQACGRVIPEVREGGCRVLHGVG